MAVHQKHADGISAAGAENGRKISGTEAAEKPAVIQVNSTAETKINEKPKENAESSIVSAIIEENRSKPTLEKKKNDRNGQINICIPPEIKTEWKLLFTKNNVNITQGIIFAVEHLRNEIENGNAILTVGIFVARK